MRRAAATVVLAAAGLMSAPASACVRLDVTIVPFLPVNDFSRSLAELTSGAVAQHRDVSAARDRGDNAVQYLMLGHVNVRRSVDIQTRLAANGCGAVVITAGYVDVVLRVARELPPGSCAFDHVYQHEMQHLAIYRAHLEWLRSSIAQRLQPLLTGDPTRWAPLAADEVARALDEVQVQHAAIDGPELHRSNMQACGGELRRLWGPRRSM